MVQVGAVFHDSYSILRKLHYRSDSTIYTIFDAVQHCPYSEGCDSCGAEVLYEMLEKMEYYMQIYNDTESGREPVDQVRKLNQR